MGNVYNVFEQICDAKAPKGQHSIGGGVNPRGRDIPHKYKPRRGDTTFCHPYGVVMNYDIKRGLAPPPMI